MNSNVNYRVTRIFHWMIVIGVVLMWVSCAEVFDLPESSSAPRITRISPDSGAVGMRVLISGRHFSKTLNENAVKFNGKDAVVEAALDTQLVALVPDHAGTGRIQVTVGKLAIEGPVFTFFETPIITSISPLEGKPGTVVTLYGKYFDMNATNNVVRFGGKIGTVIPPALDSVLTVSVPADAETGPVTVTVHGIVGIGPRFVVLPGTTPAHSITGITPTSGQAGTVVTITGVNFDPTPANNVVKFNGLTAVVNTANATTLTAVAPVGGTTGLVSVTINDITANGPTFTYVDNTPVPTITNYDPNQGFVGDVVAIVGTNFSNVVTGNIVKFNGVSAVVSQASATLLKVTVPLGATTGPITVTVGTKTATGPTFTILDNSPTITGFTPGSGPVGTPVTITGTNFGTDPAAALIMFNGVLAPTQQITPTSLITVVPVGATTGKITVTVLAKTGTSINNFIVNGGSGSLTSTGNLNYGRYSHTATLLNDGKVLIAGGRGEIGNIQQDIAPCEIYDPATGTFTLTGSLTTPRAGHSAFLLGNGKVIVIGGRADGTWANVVELYDPATGQWANAGSMAVLGVQGNTPVYRSSGKSAMLLDGRILTAGGGYLIGGNQAEIYDPATSQSILTAAMPDGDRINHAIIRLTSGVVLVAGGSAYVTNSVVYDPADAWGITGTLATRQLTWEAATVALLPNGKVLHAGGADTDGRTNTCQLFDPATGQWTYTGEMSYPRSALISLTLSNGKVLVVGGQAGNAIPAEVYDQATGQWTLTDSPVPVRSGHTLTLLGNGQVLIAGGAGSSSGGIQASHLYTP